ncbi:hypothetical protein E8E12_000467 [Didymella heteroderae]|uniref:Uncharacterized protein n=1 Tax=Didymella heteroderae TaxID=1769908 RepID=A0A9P5BWG8_9PLEO|nr:hypothetical protein E8E12_000467 [Didymella heteroderae]
MTVDHRAFDIAHTLTQGDPPEHNSNWESPLPKRRKPDNSVRVALNLHTYVRKEADVDTLFSSSEGLRTNLLGNATSAPVTSSLDEELMHMDPPPAKPCDVEYVKVGDKGSTKTGKWVRSEPESGYEMINANATDPFPELAEQSLGLEERDQYARIDPDSPYIEFPSERKFARAEWGLRQEEVQQQARRVVNRAQNIVAEVQEVIAQSLHAARRHPVRRWTRGRSTSPEPEEVHAQSHTELDYSR